MMQIFDVEEARFLMKGGYLELAAGRRPRLMTADLLVSNLRQA